jgi:hypothetical protein
LDKQCLPGYDCHNGENFGLGFSWRMFFSGMEASVFIIHCLVPDDIISACSTFRRHTHSKIVAFPAA